MGKKYEEALKKVDPHREYHLREALEILKDIHPANFDETVELHLQLGIDPRRSDQIVRGKIVFPHPGVRPKKVLVVATGEDAEKAREAGADEVYGEEFVEKVQKGWKGWKKFDVILATPQVMRFLAKVARVIGPSGMMPDTKSGRVTQKIAEVVKEYKQGRIDFRNDKTGNLHIPVGKVSMGVDEIIDNIFTAMDVVTKAKPANMKGRYIRAAYVCTTMSPALKVSLDTLTKLKKAS